MPQVYPIINGVKFDYSSAEIVLNGVRFAGIKSVSYKQTLQPGKVYGTGAQKIARTRGQHDAEGSLEMYLSDYQDFLLLLRATQGAVPRGYMEQSFDVVCNYSELLSPAVVTDVLRGCRITGTDHSASEGSDALVVKMDLDIMLVQESLLDPIKRPNP